MKVAADRGTILQIGANMKLSPKVFLITMLALMLAFFVSACTTTTNVQQPNTDTTTGLYESDTSPTESSSESNTESAESLGESESESESVRESDTDGREDAEESIGEHICVDEEFGIRDATCDVCGATVSHETIDASFEEIANEHISNADEFGFKETIIATGDLPVNSFISVPLSLLADLSTAKDTNGNLYGSEGQQIYMHSGGMELLFLYGYATTIIQRPTTGADIYRVSSQYTPNYENGDMNMEERYIYVSATAEELENHQSAGSPLLPDLPTGLSYSVNDFMAVNQRVLEEENSHIAYSCHKLRPELVAHYDELLGNLSSEASGYSVLAQIDPDSITYTIVVDADGRAIYSTLNVTLVADLGGVRAEFTCYISQEFSYAVDAIEVPDAAYDASTDTWNNEGWGAYTMDEALAYLAGTLCEGDCTDANRNCICDVCAKELADILPCAFTHKDGEPDGECDDCGCEIS